MNDRVQSIVIAVFGWCITTVLAIPIVAQTGVVDKHIIVYKESGRFAGWPANHGAWSWGDELLVGFDVGHFRKALKDHAIDYKRRAKNNVLARSLDGGETWTIEEPESLKPPRGIKVADIPVDGGDHQLTDCPGGIDFIHPDFALTARMTSVDAGQSRFYYSLDRGKNWLGPYKVPNFDQPGTAARTDYLINGKHDLTMFITAAKSNGREGRVIAVRTRDGGKTWQFQSFIGPEPAGKQWAIMPSTVRLAGGRIITAIRNSGGSIDVFASDDEGKSWRIFSTPASGIGGNPPSTVLLKDGRVVITYGYREQPYGIRARISADGGKTWGKEIVLRADGGNWDLGYPRTFIRTDGKLVTVYYYNLHPDSERFIGATIWMPPATEKIESKY